MTNDQVSYFKSLKAVRERCSMIYKLAENNSLNHFILKSEKIELVVDYVHSLIKRDYKSLSDIPPHSRWRHFDVNGIKRLKFLIENTKFATKLELTKSLLDLFVVSVLLDAGAGPIWKFHEVSTGNNITRSEGLAVASLEMFLKGAFSSNPENPYQVDSIGLARLKLDDLKSGFQINDENLMTGLEGRFELLKRLGETINSSLYFTGKEFRPGNLVDYLLSHSNTARIDEAVNVNINLLWDVVINGFSTVWPSTRTILNGVSLGDVWPCEALRKCVGENQPNFVAFHKLSQWLTYSLMEPMEEFMNIKFDGVEAMTGLPEYRNGGLFLDLGVLIPKSHNILEVEEKKFSAGDDLIVEWRALTVILLDKVAESLRQKLGLDSKQLPLAKVLEAGTWKAGREVAAKLRPATKCPPLNIVSDGTVF